MCVKVAAVTSRTLAQSLLQSACPCRFVPSPEMTRVLLSRWNGVKAWSMHLLTQIPLRASRRGRHSDFFTHGSEDFLVNWLKSSKAELRRKTLAMFY
jgi:hypothetical protein